MTSFNQSLQEQRSELNQAYRALNAVARSPCCQEVLFRQCELRGLIGEYLDMRPVRGLDALYQPNTTCQMCNGCNQEVDTILAEVATILA